MCQDDLCLVIGYDLRVWPPNPANRASPPPKSADPMVWQSVRELSPDVICPIYGVERLVDISNGINLAIDPPPASAPKGFIWAAFDAPKDIVGYLCHSFGLQHSLGRNAQMLPDEGFVLLGYDIVDLWTQTSALHHFMDGAAFTEWAINDDGLIQNRAFAKQACINADASYPAYAPFQPVGVWIRL